MSKQLVIIVGLLAALSLFAQGGEGEGGWGPDIRLTYDPAESKTGNVAVNGDTVHIVWHDGRDANTEIYYKRSVDNGLTWCTDIRLTNNTANSLYPSIAAFGNNLHLVWEDNRDGNVEVYYKKSTDGGISWGADTRLTNGASIPEGRPRLAVYGNNIHIVWGDTRNSSSNFEIYYKHSTDNGATWSSDIRLTNNTTGSFSPDVAAWGDNVHIVWWDDQNSSAYETFYKRSTDNGSTWSSDKRLSLNDGYRSDCGSVAVWENNVHVAFHDARFGYGGEEEVYYVRSTDNGTNWYPEIRITDASGRSENPEPAVYGNTIHLIWEDTRDGNYELYYKKSNDNGNTWSSDKRLTDNTSTSWGRSIAVSDSTAHIAWYDNRDGNWEVYYKRYFTNPNIAPLAEVIGTSLNPGGNRDVDKLNDEYFPAQGTFSDFWESAYTTGNAGDVWMQYEWEIPFALEASIFYCHPAAAPHLNLPIEYNIEAWINGAWQEIAHVTNTDSSKAIYMDNLQDVITTGVRINLIDVRDTDTWGLDVATIGEWEIYGDSAPMDAGTVAIDAPGDTVWSEHSYTPRATVENFGAAAASFNVVCEFDTSGVLAYADTTAVADLEGGQTRQVSFAPWAAGEANGILYNMSVKTVMPGDIDTTNDKLSRSVFAVWPPRDVAAVAIITPPDFVWSGFAHIPRVWVKNLWEEAETFDVACMIDSLASNIYIDTAQVTNLGGGDSLLLEFDPWSAGAVDTFSYQVTFITQLAKDLNRCNDTIVKEIHAVREVADIDIQDYAGNLSANTMFLTGARNAILVGSYVMVNPDNWQKNVDLYDGPANTDLTLSYYCTDLVLFNGGKTIPAESVQVNVKQIATLALGEAALNIVQVPLFHTQAPSDPQHFVGTVTVTARSEGMIVSDEFTLEVKQVAGSASLASSLCFGGEPLPEGNRLYWSRFGFGEQGYKLYRAKLGSDDFAEISDNPPGTIECSDYDVEPQTGYKYKLGLEMPDGKEITIGPLSLTSSEDVGRIVLYETAPNPWADATEIRYFIPKTVSLAQLKIYDITGKLVKILVDGPQDAGEHSITWSGTDERGRKVSSGVYFYVLETGSQNQTKKTVLIR